MNKQDAELTARVARRIGAYTDCVQEHGDGWAAIVTWSKDGGFHVFDPTANPADERRVWDWLTRERMDVAFESTRDRIVCTVKYIEWGTGVSPCRVTALLKAIDALPE